jgi:hypothetical protein
MRAKKILFILFFLIPVLATVNAQVKLPLLVRDKRDQDKDLGMGCKGRKTNCSI